MCCNLNVFFVRQLSMLFALNLTTSTIGLMSAFPSILNPAILASNGEIKATPDQASWITACLSISGMIGYIILPPFFEILGRKATNITTNFALLIGCITYYVANDVYALAMARLMQGVCLPGSYIFAISVCECISPRRRGYFLVLNKISLALGALACHSLSFVLNWRQIAIVSTLPICMSMIIIISSAESPSFYASKGCFDKCSKSFTWYRGNSLKSQKEMKELVVAQTEIYKTKEKEKHINFFKRMRNMIMSKVFQKSFCIVTLAKLCLDFCGRYFVLAYITQILKEVTNSQSSAMYLSVVSDFIAIIALSISYFLIRRFDRRVLLFNLGFCSVFLMFLISLTLILGNRLNLLHHVKWLTPTVIIAHLFVTNVGLIPLLFTLSGEIFCLEHRGLGSFTSGIVFMSFYTFVLKYTPFLMDNTGVEGVYSIYGSVLLILLFILRYILIETKDKTLQQIEDELRGKVETQLETELLNLKVNNL